MVNAHDFLLRVTAGPSYDPSTHTVVPVNSAKSTSIHSSKISSNVAVRIQNYRGLPHNSPTTSSYFSADPHKHDLYSIAFSFSLKEAINGNDLLFGNDFDKPIRDRLPPGFGTAFRIVKWAVDPGLQGDVHADEPYLYGPLLSSINVFAVGEKGDATNEVESKIFEEGGEGQGVEARKNAGMVADAAARKKEYLNEDKRKEWEFESGREYRCDFFNPYLDFNEFSLKLPGFTLPIISYWDGQPLRYVLKHKTADGSVDEPLFVIVFTLVPKEEVESKNEVAKQPDADESTDTNAKDDNHSDPKSAAALGVGASKHATSKEEAADFVDDDVD